VAFRAQGMLKHEGRLQKKNNQRLKQPTKETKAASKRKLTETPVPETDAVTKRQRSPLGAPPNKQEPKRN